MQVSIKASFGETPRNSSFFVENSGNQNQLAATDYAVLARVIRYAERYERPDQNQQVVLIGSYCFRIRIYFGIAHGRKLYLVIRRRTGVCALLDDGWRHVANRRIESRWAPRPNFDTRPVWLDTYDHRLLFTLATQLAICALGKRQTFRMGIGVDHRRTCRLGPGHLSKRLHRGHHLVVGPMAKTSELTNGESAPHNRPLAKPDRRTTTP